MKELIENFSQQIIEAISIAKKQNLRTKSEGISNVVFIGMGGSGIGSRIVAQLVEQEIKFPISFIQNYQVPAWIDKNTLVIATSYSGNTEETLSALEKCIQKGSRIIGICSGGRLLGICNQNQFDVVIVPPGYPPRAALAYSVVLQLYVLKILELISEKCIIQINNCSEFLTENQEKIQLKAKEVVQVINGTTPVIYAETPYESVAIRGKQQFNENSKYLCRYHVLPEMNHNELLGWASADSSHSAIFLYNSDMNDNNFQRFELTRKIIEEKTNNIISIYAKGENQMEQTFYLINILDWSSYYLGVERGIDVMEIEKIDYLKSKLAHIN